MLDSFNLLVLTLYFQLIYSEWVPITIVGIILQVYGTIMMFFIPESPKFLMDQKRIEEVE
jgi:hypothetical protein